VWVFAQTAEALEECADARHNEAAAAPAMRRHLEIVMMLEPSLIPADNDVSSEWFPAKLIFLERNAIDAGRSRRRHNFGGIGRIFLCAR
jgi:hypothetical protein